MPSSSKQGSFAPLEKIHEKRNSLSSVIQRFCPAPAEGGEDPNFGEMGSGMVKDTLLKEENPGSHTLLLAGSSKLAGKASEECLESLSRCSDAMAICHQATHVLFVVQGFATATFCRCLHASSPFGDGDNFSDNFTLETWMC